MKMIMILAAVAAASMLTGCATTFSPEASIAKSNAKAAKYKAQAEAYAAHAEQARAVDFFCVTGTNVSFVIKGANRIAFSQPTDLIGQMEREPSGAEIWADVGKSVINQLPSIGVAAMGITQALNPASHTRDISNTSSSTEHVSETVRETVPVAPTPVPTPEPAPVTP
jgi:hypothetical protein